MDAEASFASDRFQNFLRSIDCNVECTTPDSHWSIIGLVERHNSTVKVILRKLLSSNQSSKHLRFSDFCQIASSAKNSSFLYGDISPNQAVYGKSGVINLKDESFLSHNSLEATRFKVLEKARKLIVSSTLQSKISRALNRRPRGKTQASSLQPGTECEYFDRKLRSWVGPFRCLAIENERVYLSNSARVFIRHSTLVRPFSSKSDCQKIYFTADSDLQSNSSHVFISEESGDDPAFRGSDYKELQSILENDVLEPVDTIPANSNVLNARIIRIFKFDGKAKSRLVVQGHKDSRVFGPEISSPTPHRESIRYFFSYAASTCARVTSFDVKTAFLQGTYFDHTKATERIYVRVNKDRHLDSSWSGKCFLLKKALYGLSDASQRWLDRFFILLRENNFQQSRIDSCFWTLKDSTARVLHHVKLVFVLSGFDSMILNTIDFLWNRYFLTPE